MRRGDADFHSRVPLQTHDVRVVHQRSSGGVRAAQTRRRGGRTPPYFPSRSVPSRLRRCGSLRRRWTSTCIPPNARCTSCDRTISWRPSGRRSRRNFWSRTTRERSSWDAWAAKLAAPLSDQRRRAAESTDGERGRYCPVRDVPERKTRRAERAEKAAKKPKTTARDKVGGDHKLVRTDARLAAGSLDAFFAPHAETTTSGGNDDAERSDEARRGAREQRRASGEVRLVGRRRRRRSPPPPRLIPSRTGETTRLSSVRELWGEIVSRSTKV